MIPHDVFSVMAGLEAQGAQDITVAQSPNDPTIVNIQFSYQPKYAVSTININFSIDPALDVFEPGNPEPLPVRINWDFGPMWDNNEE